MKKKVKILSLALCLLFGGGALFAQYDHEFSLYGGGGLSTLRYKATIGDQKFGLGADFGLGYHFFFSPKWGLGTGAELAFYNARYQLDQVDVRYNATDRDGNPFQFRSTVTGYREKQHAMLLQIPLMVQFQTDKPDSRRQFFAAAGGKVGFPMSINGKYSNKASLGNAGFYELENSLYDTQEFMGFGNFPDRKHRGDLNFKTAFFLSAEAGFKWRLHEKWSLYAGVYVDYGLNNIVKKQNASSKPHFVAYNGSRPAEFAMNSIIHSQYTQNDRAPQAFTGKVQPVAAGIKVRLAFGKGGKQAEPQQPAQAQPAPQPAPAPVVDNNDDARRLAEEAARKAADEAAAARRAAEEAAARKAAADEAARKAADEAALNAAKKRIQIPIDNYTLGQTEPNASQKENLDEIIALLKKYPQLQFYIHGHTCDIGTSDANERIGNGRDVKARAYMMAKGIPENRILGSESKRDTQPVVPNTSEENRQKNRRVQFVIP